MTVLGLTWFSHRRTTELCDGLQIELVELTTRRRGLARYMLLAWRTARLLRHRRPTALLVQNPSLVLAAWVIVLRPIWRYRLVVDAHNEAVEPFLNRGWCIRMFTRWVLRRADLVIVTNDYLGKTVMQAGGRYFVLPDRVPLPPPTAAMTLPQGFNVALIATFAADEPVAEVLQAVRGLDLNLFVTGNNLKLDPRVRAAAPENVTFLGFLQEEDYWALLSGIDAIVDLTVMDNCLVCGAYEALALGKPALLSDNPASRKLFGAVAVLVGAGAESIRAGLLALRDQQRHLEQRIPAHRATMRMEWIDRAAELRNVLSPPP